MHVSPSIRAVCCLLLLLIAPLTVAAADVLQNVPKDALGFVVIKNLGATDAKANQLLETFHANFIGPLVFLQAITGVEHGLDKSGDLLMAVLPATEASGSPRFALWLPVSDHDALLKSLGAQAGEKIAAVSVADEDVLVAKHGSWALVMDPDQRSSMEQMIAAASAPPAAIAAWSEWLGAQDVAVVALRDGIHSALGWARGGSPPAAAQSRNDFESVPFEFGPGEPEVDQFAAPTVIPEPGDIAGVVQTEIRRWTSDTPKLNEWLMRADALAVGVRLDASGSAIAGLRARTADQQTVAISESISQSQGSLHESGNFVFHGAGKVPRELGDAVAGMLVRSVLHELKENERVQLSEARAAEFKQAIERAVADVSAFEVLNQAGDGKAGVYTNEFLAVTSNDAAVFAGHAGEVMQIWNAMNSESQGPMPLAFAVEDVKLGERMAKQYSLDIAAADGAPPLPEIRQAMEKFFGPSGKVRLWIVPLDQNTVLLASATQDEVTRAIAAFDRKQTTDWQRAALEPASKLLPQQADGRLYFSLHGYNVWLRRYYEAMMGENVIGGPLVKEFGTSPPVGFTANLRNGELQIDAAVPAEAIKAAGEYRAK